MPDDGKRYELINGEVFVTPSPSEKHQRVAGRLFLSMATHVEENKLGRVYFAPFDVVLSEKHAVQPDIIFVSAARMGIIGPEYIVGPPDLLVEILSPQRVAFDRVTKFAQYAHFGVGEYWIVDPIGENVDVYRLVGSNYELVGAFSGDQAVESPLLPGWRLTVRNLFAD